MHSKLNDPPRLAPWCALREYQPAVWFAIGLLYFGFDVGRVGESGVEALFGLFVRAAVWAALGMALTSMVSLLYGRIQLDRRGRITAVIAVAASLLGAATWLVAFVAIDGAVSLEDGFEPLTHWPSEQVFAELMNYSFALLVWHGAAFAFVALQRGQHASERALKAGALAQTAQLAALRAQLNPHFLFNALNSAIALVEIEPRKAEHVLTELAAVLATTLRQGAGATTTLNDELDTIRRILAIEKIRFEERLQITEDVSDAAGQTRLPPLLLLPLIDNAIKHGMRTSPMPLQIEIRGWMAGNVLMVQIANTGSLDGERLLQKDSGVGIPNIQQRLTTEPGFAGALTITEADGWVTVTLKLEEQAP